MACLNMTKNFQIDAEACRTIETAMCANPYETENNGAGQHEPEAQTIDWNGDQRLGLAGAVESAMLFLHQSEHNGTGVFLAIAKKPFPEH